MTLTLPGFANPVTDAQSCFRAVLTAMSQPGAPQRITAELAAPPPLGIAAAAVLLTLVDGDTTLHLPTPGADAADWVRFHCGTDPSPNMADAAFLFAETLPDLATLAQGSDEAPQESATLILQVASLTAGARFTLRGPGLQTSAPLTVTGLPADFAARWAANHAQFPRGVDLILCAGNTLLALPRSLTIEDA